jgi:hypothetical protein
MESVGECVETYEGLIASSGVACKVPPLTMHGVLDTNLLSSRLTITNRIERRQKCKVPSRMCAYNLRSSVANDRCQISLIRFPLAIGPLKLSRRMTNTYIFQCVYASVVQVRRLSLPSGISRRTLIRYRVFARTDGPLCSGNQPPRTLPSTK